MSRDRHVCPAVYVVEEGALLFKVGGAKIRNEVGGGDGVERNEGHDVVSGGQVCVGRRFL